MKNKLQLFALILFALYLSGCSAVYTSVAKSDLQTRTKMSKTIFLEPYKTTERIIFVQVRNGSDDPAFELETQIENRLRQRGYMITDDPELANYWLQANVRHVVRDDGQYGEEAVSKGFDGAVTGGYIGSAFGDGDGKVAAVVAGALIGLAIEASTSDVYYTAVTDVLVSVRSKNGEVIKSKENTRVELGANGSRRTTSEGTTDMKQYQTRIVASANKVNLEYEEAAYSLRNGLVSSISGIF